MVELDVDAKSRAKARAEARKMGILYKSITKGAGNEIGMLGEILVHKALGGKRVGHKIFAYDIVLPDGTTVDVKTGRGKARPEPHFTARVYGSEASRDKIGSKCDYYYFVRSDVSLKKVFILGYIEAAEFARIAEFTPKGNINPDDGKLTYSDEFTVPISALKKPPQLFDKLKTALGVANA